MAKVSTNRGPANIDGRNNEKTYMLLWLFCAWLHSRKKKPISLSSIVWQFKWLSRSRKIIEIHKCCYHGNVTSHAFSCALTKCGVNWLLPLSWHLSIHDECKVCGWRFRLPFFKLYHDIFVVQMLSIQLVCWTNKFWRVFFVILVCGSLWSIWM